MFKFALSVSQRSDLPMLKKLNLKRFLNPAFNRNLKVKEGKEAELQLMLGNLEVGRLWYKNGKWIFKYSAEFKETPGIKTLADFPDIHKTYENQELWPFFSSRIPSTARPRVKKVLEREGINDSDLLSLLIRFGKHTITNPFELQPVK